MIKNYRKKPLVIKALKFTGNNEVEIINFVGTDKLHFLTRWDKEQEDKDIKNTLAVIETLEGDIFAEPGDYIIQGIKGEFYPCKPDIFKVTYDEVG